MVRFGFETTGQEVVKAFKDQVKGRYIAVTGPSANGIGGEIALALAAASPAHLVLLSRNFSAIQPVVEAIKTQHPSTATTIIHCDLADQGSIRNAVTEIILLTPHIDILINNAAAPPKPISKTEDGVESQFGVNHLGHFLLTNLLLLHYNTLPLPARIVNVSSSAHRYATSLHLDDINFSDGATYTEAEGYYRSKAANVIFTKSLASQRKWQGKGILAFSVHPGAIESGMQSQVSEEVMMEARKKAEEAGRVWGKSKRKTVQQGCATILVAALDPGLVLRSGAYLEDCNVVEKMSALVEDEEIARELWKVSEKLVSQEF